MESGTQFEHPGSRPSSAQGRILTAGTFSPALGPRSKSTEPRVLDRMQGKRSHTATPTISKGERKGDRSESPGNTRFPALRQPPEQTPFLLPLQKSYAPQLLLNHFKSMRSSSRISHSPSLEDTGSIQNRSLTPAASFEDGYPARTKTGDSSSNVQPFRSRSTESLNTVSAVSSLGPAPSIFGSVNKAARNQGAKRATSPQKESKSGSREGKPGKAVTMPAEEVDTYVTSAKDLQEAKELFRQFDTDGDGTLSMSEIQASLYYNNVDFEEIQAILGPNGIKCSHKEKVSVEDFAQFLCRRRRENANRHQNFQISKHSRIMRVYVSSCLHQHHRERAILHEKVFGKLSALCERHGGELRVVDLRYHAGPCEETFSGPGQAEVMQELSRVATDTNHFFIGLVADLPGECVLPAEVSAAEYETLKASAKIFESTSDEKGLVQALENLYRLDRNSITQSYVLQPGSKQDVHVLLRAFSDYDGDDKNLHSSFSKIRAKMAKSLCEQEFFKCHSLGAELDHAKRTFIFVRTIEDMPTSGIPETPSLQQILVGKSEEEIMQILERQHLIKESMAAGCLPGHVYQYKVPCTPENLKITQTSPYAMKAMVEVRDQEYLEMFANQVFDSLKGPILAKLDQTIASALQMELDAQITIMKRDAAAIFRYENDLVKEILDYVHGSPERAANQEKVQNSTIDAKTRKRAKEELEKQALPNCPLIITGTLGAGRTVLLARMAEMLSYSKEASRFALIYRCINATPYSSDGRLFLDGLCEELAKLAGNTRTGPRPPSYNALLVEYSQSLLMLSNKKPVILFLDGLDQLPTTDHCRRLSWLPSVLPDNVYIVCSSLPTEPLAIQTYQKQNIKIIKNLEVPDMKDLINHWLENYKQGLQENQKDDIIRSSTEAFQSPSGKSVTASAQLHWAFSEATNNVASFAAPDKLSEMVSSPGIHLTECLGLLLASIGGLTETELMTLLRIEEECKATNALPHRRFHRLLQRVAPYTTSRERDSRIVISIRHDSFKGILMSMEPYPSRLKEWSQTLASFYSSQETKHIHDDGKVSMNMRKLRYVIYYQLNGEMWEEAGKALCSLVSIQAMCEAGMSVELQKIYTTALRTIPASFESRYGLETIKIFYRFFTRIRQALENHSRMIEQPGIIVQMAANEPLNTLPEQQAQEILAADAASRVWMQAINKAISVSPLSVTLIGNKSTVRASHVSFDGSYIATSADGGNIRIWDAETGESITTLMEHTGDITVVMFLPSGRTLVSGSTDSTAKVWDEPNAKCLCTYEQHKAPILGLAVAPDGELIATSCQANIVRVWKLDGSTMHVLTGHSDAVRACNFSPDGLKLASASLDKTVRVWDLASGKQTVEFRHRGKVYDVHFTKDSSKLLASSSFATCTLWDAASGVPDSDLNMPLKEFRAGNGSCLSCSPMDEDRILCMASEQGKLYFWDMEKDDRPLMELKAHSEIIHKVSVSLDGQWLVTSGADKVARVWNLKTAIANIEIEKARYIQENAESHEEPSFHESESNAGQEEEDAQTAKMKEDEMPDIVRSVAISEDSAYGVSCSEHGSLLVWDILKAEIISRCVTPAIARIVKFHPLEANSFWAACDDGIVRVYNIQEKSVGNQLFSVREICCHDLCIRSLKFARDGSRFVTGSIDATAAVWSLTTFSQELCLRGHKDTVLDAEMSSNFALVATSSTDKTVRVWNARTGKEQWVGKHAGYVYSCIFTPDCKRVISASGDRTARVWASKKGECLNILTASSALLLCSISDVSNLLMCAGYQGSLHFWETKSYSAPPVNGIGHEAEIRCAEFSQYGTYAVTASNDQSVRLFDSRTGASLGALPVQYPIYSMASKIDEERAVCMCGDEAGHVLIVRISGIRDVL